MLHPSVDDPSEVDWQIGKCIGFGEGPFGFSLACGRGGGDEEEAVFLFLAEFSKEGLGCLHFSNGNSVDPNDGPMGGYLRDFKSQPLEKLRMALPLEYPVYEEFRGNDQQVEQYK